MDRDKHKWKEVHMHAWVNRWLNCHFCPLLFSFFPPSNVRNTSLPSLVCSPYTALCSCRTRSTAQMSWCTTQRLRSVLAQKHTHKHTPSNVRAWVCLCVSLTLTHPMTLFLYLSQLNAHFRAAFCQDMKGVCECLRAEITASTQLHAKVYEQIITKTTGQTTEIICSVFH